MLKRDSHVSEEEAWRRIKAQMPLVIKAFKADIVVTNNGTQEELIQKMDQNVVPQLFNLMKIKVPLASQRS